MNNENLAPRWELGDAITIRLPDDDTDTEPEPDDDPAVPEP